MAAAHQCLFLQKKPSTDAVDALSMKCFTLVYHHGMQSKNVILMIPVT